jgi:butyryl-CoA dehydrogenase
MLRATVRDFADQVLAPNAARYDESEEFPWDNVRGLAELGILGLTIGEEYGGSGGTTRHLAIVAEEIARGCGSTSVILVAHLSLCTEFIATFGTPAQKQRWVPALASAETIGAFALTEPGSGSDAAAMRTTVAGDEGGYVLNGSKLFTTNAEEAGVFVILATHDRELRSKGVSALVVEREAGGFSINPQHGKMGMRATSTAELVFEDCAVPGDQRLGGEREGFAETMEILNSSRIGIAAQSVGLAQAAYEAAVEYAAQREAFGKHLAAFQGIRWTLADMATDIAAALRDTGKPFVTAASMAKLFASRVAVESADRAMQIHGGTGYFAPTTVERLYRDAKVTEIYEGTSEVQRMIISRNLLDEEGQA